MLSAEQIADGWKVHAGGAGGQHRAVDYRLGRGRNICRKCK